MVWKRNGLAPRDRSVVTVAALIARIQTIEMSYHFALALDNGVKPAGYRRSSHIWPSMPDGQMPCPVLRSRRHLLSTRHGVDQLPPGAKEKLLPLNEEGEKQRLRR
jgi:4-carboxymuconolactone decarboxylase